MCGSEDLGEALGGVVELVVAQRHAVVAHEVEESEGKRTTAQSKVVERAHGPIAGVHEDHRMARAGADVVYVSGDSGVSTRGAHAGYPIDVKAHMVGAIGVMVQVRGLQDGDLCVAVDLGLDPNRDREHGQDKNRSKQYKFSAVHVFLL